MNATEQPTGFLCGPARGKDGAMRCPCCGFESHDPETFAVSMCWRCGFALNVECANCVEAGVWVDRFSTRRGKGHRLTRPLGPGEDAPTACGLTIPSGDIGHATAVRKPCKRCFAEDTTDGR